MNSFNLRTGIILLLALPLAVKASGSPVMGPTKADEHMLCGKDIIVNVQYLNAGFIVLGLTNQQNRVLDTFISEQPMDNNSSPTRFALVKFDSLSEHYVKQESKLDILLGKESVNGNKSEWSLTLGSHQYQCGALVRWPDESADQIYGEADQ